MKRRIVSREEEEEAQRKNLFLKKSFCVKNKVRGIKEN